MTVYLDILFLRELLVDGVLILTTGWVRKCKPNPWRVLAAASIGATYVVVGLFPEVSFLFNVVIKILFSLLILYVAFGFHSLQVFVRDVITFYCVNFVAAGAILGIYYLFMNSSNEIWKSITIGDDGVHTHLKFGLVYFFTAFAIGIYLYRTVLSQKQTQHLTDQHLAKVDIYIDEKHSSCTGLIDTGNQLYDPLTRVPVMVMQSSCLPLELPSFMQEAIRKGEIEKMIVKIDTSEQTFEWQDRIRFVPYRGVNRNSQFMLAIKPDKVVVHCNGQTYETKKLLIGFDGGKLSIDNSYQAIIHPALIQVSS